jgi:hypothetical protein
MQTSSLPDDIHDEVVFRRPDDNYEHGRSNPIRAGGFPVSGSEDNLESYNHSPTIGNGPNSIRPQL